MKEIVAKAYKYRIYPTEEQKEFFYKHFGCTRFIYNYLLNIRSTSWKEKKINISGLEAKKMIAPLKKKEEYSWLKEVNSQSLQESALDLEKAYKRFFKGLAGYPRFKKKTNEQSFAVPQHFTVDYDNDFIKIPKLDTSIKVLFHREMENIKKVNSLTISKTPSEKYYVSVNVNEEIEHKDPVNKIKANTKTIGIDLGLKDFVADSKGNKISSPKFLRKLESRLKGAQKRLSKKQKGSNNRNKQRNYVAKLHEKIKEQRSDFLHKLTHKLVHENQVICLEDLNVRGMMKNRCLSKSIADSGWGEFARQLKYKAQWYGSIIVQIGRFEPSSKLCSTENCDYINENLKLSQRTWTCPKCNTTHDRDINAAVNIEKIGRGTSELKPVEKVTAVFSIKKIQVASVKQESLASL